MCKASSRTLYVRSENKILKYTLSYTRIDEKTLRSFDEFGGDFSLWLIERLNTTPHIPTVRATSERFEMATILGNRAYYTRRLSNGRPRYITVLTVTDEHCMAVAGGSAVCAAVDIPDRALGYKLAFERMRESLHNSGYEIVSKVEAEGTAL